MCLPFVGQNSVNAAFLGLSGSSRIRFELLPCISNPPRFFLFCVFHSSQSFLLSPCCSCRGRRCCTDIHHNQSRTSRSEFRVLSPCCKSISPVMFRTGCKRLKTFLILCQLSSSTSAPPSSVISCIIRRSSTTSSLLLSVIRRVFSDIWFMYLW